MTWEYLIKNIFIEKKKGLANTIKTFAMYRSELVMCVVQIVTDLQNNR